MKIEELVQTTLRQVFHDPALLFDKSRFAGGLTNYNYIMTIQGCDYVIRQPGGLTELMIDRQTEHTNNTLASEFGVNSDCIYFDSISGIKISVYIPHSRNMAQAGPVDEKNIRIVAQLMKQVHAIPEQLPNHFDWYAELKKYEQLIAHLKGAFFTDYEDLKLRLLAYTSETKLQSSLVPCHNDTVPENFIISDTGRAYLIDWEYAGMNDACWDVAAYILESRLPQPAIHCLIHEYFSRHLTPAEKTKIKLSMLEQDLLWTTWALVRHYNGDDFLDYCDLRYERFRKNMAHLTDSDYPLAEMVK